MINDELLSKFDRIKDLPVSEELLGAYMEGNLSSEENLSIETVLEIDENLSKLTNDIYQEKKCNSNDFSVNFFSCEQIEIDDLSLPNNIILDLQSQLTMEIQNNQTSLGASAAARIYGEEGAGKDPNFDPLICQGNEGVCAIRSQQIILRDYGIDISLEDLKQFAIQNGWYDPSGEGGTPMGAVGALLASCGIEVRQDINCTVYDLVNELAQGHRIIVGVDANELWADRSGSLIDKTKAWFDDVFNGEQANHALVVAGVEVNPDNPDDVKVILTDPGTGDLRIEYTLDQFMDAWEDSECFMVTTTTPAPYQYDPVHGCEVPSNFAVEQYIAYNALPLNADVRGIEFPEGYAAYYSEGHLDVVGTDEHGLDVTYDKFHSEFSQLKQSLGGIPGTLGQDHFDKKEFMNSLKSLFGFGEEQSPQNVLDSIKNVDSFSDYVPSSCNDIIPGAVPEPVDEDMDDEDMDDDDGSCLMGY